MKTELVQIISDFLLPFQDRYNGLEDSYVEEILRTHSAQVAKIAEAKIEEVYKKVGLLL